MLCLVLHQALSAPPSDVRVSPIAWPIELNGGSDAIGKDASELDTALGVLAGLGIAAAVAT